MTTIPWGYTKHRRRGYNFVGKGIVNNLVTWKTTVSKQR